MLRKAGGVIFFGSHVMRLADNSRGKKNVTLKLAFWLNMNCGLTFLWLISHTQQMETTWKLWPKCARLRYWRNQWMENKLLLFSDRPGWKCRSGSFSLRQLRTWGRMRCELWSFSAPTSWAAAPRSSRPTTSSAVWGIKTTCPRRVHTCCLSCSASSSAPVCSGIWISAHPHRSTASLLTGAQFDGDQAWNKVLFKAHGSPTQDWKSFQLFTFSLQSRKLLYQMSEDLTKDDLKNIKFLLDKKLPRKKLENDIVSAA